MESEHRYWASPLGSGHEKRLNGGIMCVRGACLPPRSVGSSEKQLGHLRPNVCPLCEGQADLKSIERPAQVNVQQKKKEVRFRDGWPKSLENEATQTASWQKIQIRFLAATSCCRSMPVEIRELSVPEKGQTDGQT